MIFIQLDYIQIKNDLFQSKIKNFVCSRSRSLFLPLRHYLEFDVFECSQSEVICHCKFVGHVQLLRFIVVKKFRSNSNQNLVIFIRLCELASFLCHVENLNCYRLWEPGDELVFPEINSPFVVHSTIGVRLLVTRNSCYGFHRVRPRWNQRWSN